MRNAIVAAGALLALALPALARAETACADLMTVKLPHAEVTSARVEVLASGEACKITVTSRPTPVSDIKIEV